MENSFHYSFIIMFNRLLEIYENIEIKTSVCITKLLVEWRTSLRCFLFPCAKRPVSFFQICQSLFHSSSHTCQPHLKLLHQIFHHPPFHRIDVDPPINLAATFTVTATWGDLDRRHIRLETDVAIHDLVGQTPLNWINGSQFLLGPADGVFALLRFDGEAAAVSDAAGLTVDAVDAVTAGETRKPFMEVKKVSVKGPNLICCGFL